MKFLLIINPSARSGRSVQLDWETRLHRAGLDFRCIRSGKAGDVFHAARSAQAGETVVAAGGETSRRPFSSPATTRIYAYA